MIERLMDMERSYGEPEYGRLSQQITQLRRTLERQLDQEGLADLERLSDGYIRQGGILLRSGFTEGFCCAVELMLEYHKSTDRT